MTVTQDELLADAPVARADHAALPWALRQLVLARDNWACLCCDRSILGRAYALHQRKPRQLGGDMSATNLITVLAECGERIRAGADPADEARGFRLGSCDEPALVHVAYSTPAGRQKAWLLPGGGRTFEPPERGLQAPHAELLTAAHGASTLGTLTNRGHNRDRSP